MANCLEILQILRGFEKNIKFGYSKHIGSRDLLYGEKHEGRERYGYGTTVEGTRRDWENPNMAYLSRGENGMGMGQL